jgi:tRNA (guanine9-N1)-methyltransferase
MDATLALRPCERRRLRKEKQREENKARRREMKAEKKKRRREEEKNGTRERKIRIPRSLESKTLQEKLIAGYTVILDGSFFHLMTEKEQNSLRQQLVRCYAANRQAPQPMNLVLTGATSALLRGLEEKNGSGSWLDGWRSTENCYMDEFPPEKIVYLTADAEETLTKLQPDETYVVGAFVDRNRHKGITLKKAEQQGVRTAKLPLSDYLHLTGSCVLTVNQVVEIMLQTLAHHGDFGEGVRSVMPARKLKPQCSQQQPAPASSSIEQNPPPPATAASAATRSPSQSFLRCSIS